MDGSQATEVVRVMLVGQHPVLRQSLREIVEREADLAGEPRLAVVAEARDLEEAVVAARALQPDVVVLDASMAKEEGISALRQSPARGRALRVICVSLTCDREHVMHALRAGACGFLRTEDAAEELVPALRGASPERPFLGGAVNRDEIRSLLAQGGRKPSLLVIGDDSEVAEATRLALEAAGYEVWVVGDADEGLRLVKSARPDGIILDVKVPACSDGFHFVWELRKDGDAQIRNTPVLVVTSVGEEVSPGAQAEEPEALGKPYEYLPVQDFIRRPLQAGQLLDRVRSLVPSRTT